LAPRTRRRSRRSAFGRRRDSSRADHIVRKGNKDSPDHRQRRNRRYRRRGGCRQSDCGWDEHRVHPEDNDASENGGQDGDDEANVDRDGHRQAPYDQHTDHDYQQAADDCSDHDVLRERSPTNYNVVGGRQRRHNDE
jgi:hypothetical protein